MRPGEVLRLEDGTVVTASEVGRVLPIVRLRDLRKVYGRINVRHRTKGGHVIGRDRTGALALARFLRPTGWHEVPGGWCHENLRRTDPLPRDTYHQHMGAAATPFISWQPEEAIS
jgi:hypothetical protein